MNKYWTVFLQTGDKVQLTSDSLKAMISDITSWHSFLVMLCTGKPAVMRIQRQDGVVDVVKVIFHELVGARATYENPLA